MDLLQKRSKAAEAILKKRYITEVLREEGQEMDKAMLKKMASFTPETIGKRTFTVNNNTLGYLHAKRLRFIDMKTRQTKKGKKKKKSYPIHNRPIFGVANNIIKRLSFGFTEATKEKLQRLDNTKL